MGDRAWRELLDRHDTLLGRSSRGVRRASGEDYRRRRAGDARRPVTRGRMRVRDPQRARRVWASQIRAGVHTGEVERRGDDVGGIGVNIGSRVAALAGPGEVWVSRTVKDLTTGSGLSPSRTAAVTSSKASPTSGSSTRWSDASRGRNGCPSTRFLPEKGVSSRGASTNCGGVGGRGAARGRRAHWTTRSYASSTMRCPPEKSKTSRLSAGGGSTTSSMSFGTHWSSSSRRRSREIAERADQHVERRADRAIVDRVGHVEHEDAVDRARDRVRDRHEVHDRAVDEDVPVERHRREDPRAAPRSRAAPAAARRSTITISSPVMRSVVTTRSGS